MNTLFLRKAHMHEGYILLLSVLFVGAISLAVVGSLMLFSIASQKSGLSLKQSAQALANAQTCIEHGLLELFENNSYDGDETITIGEDSCYILTVGGSGNTNRSLCAEGMSGKTTRRLEVVIEEILPSIEIYAWQEVTLFSSCDY